MTVNSNSACLRASSCSPSSRFRVHTSGNGAEPLLPGGIPDLELDALAIELDGANFEVNADGCDEGGSKRVVRETKKQTALADACRGIRSEEAQSLARCGSGYDIRSQQIDRTPREARGAR